MIENELAHYRVWVLLGGSLEVPSEARWKVERDHVLARLMRLEDTVFESHTHRLDELDSKGDETNEEKRARYVAWLEANPE